MSSRIWRCSMIALAAGVLLPVSGQRGGRGITNPEDMPAASQAANTEISRSKAEWQQNIKDATRLAELAGKVKEDLTASSSFTLSLATVKNAGEMAKLSKTLYSRLKSAGAQPDGTQNVYDARHPGPPKEW